MNRSILAQKLFKEGYNCSQSVVLAFSDIVNVDKLTLQKISLPLGGGLGRLRLTCGAVSGMALIIGLIFTKEENSNENKKYVYELTREVIKRFEDKYHTITCKDLLEQANLEVEIKGSPEERTKEYYQKRPCDVIVKDAAEILENFLIEKGIIIDNK